METLIKDIRFGVRSLIKRPGFTALAIITLALGIGASTAIFSVVDAVLIRPLPYENHERLAVILHDGDAPVSPANFADWRDQSRSFESMGAAEYWTPNVTGAGEPEKIWALHVTPSIFPMLGIAPLLGRTFLAEEGERGAEHEVVIGYSIWQRRFGGDPRIVGESITLDGAQYTVVGVMPRDFKFAPFWATKAELWAPLVVDAAKGREANSLRVFARLAPGVSLRQAQAEMATVTTRLEQEYPGTNRDISVQPLKDKVVGDIRPALLVELAAVGFVLLIACANVAHMLLARAAARRKELALRTALGASRARVVRQLLIESLLLALLGSGLGIALAYWGIGALVAISPRDVVNLQGVRISLPVLAWTLGVSVVTGLLFGLVPALEATRLNLSDSLKEGGKGAGGQGARSSRLRGVLVVAEVALALVLLVSSGLMIRTLAALKRVQPGFQRPAEILTLRISIPRAGVAEPERVARMQMEIREKLASLPGVSSVGLSSSITMDGAHSFDPIYVEGRVYAESQIPPMRRYKFVGPGYFQTMGNPLQAGRDITWTDIFDQRPVILISENLAREYWDSPAAAIGKRIRENNKGVWREIIGVVGNDRDSGVNQKAPTTVYWPVLVKDLWRDALSVSRTMVYAIRSNRTGTAGFLKDVQQAVWSVNPNLPLADVRTVQDLYERSMGRTSFAFVMLAVASGMALLLGIVGIYGVISYSVTQRTREIGIRMALGARRQEVIRMFVRHGLTLTAIGVFCGLTAAAALMRWMAALLFEVRPVDPATYAAVSIVLLTAAICASYLPARRATVIEPVEALRSE